MEVEATAGGQRRLTNDFREVLVEEHASDELLSRGDAELLVQIPDVVLDGVWRHDKALRDLGAGQATG